MPIDTDHPLYSANKGIWTKCRDFIEGEDSVKAKGEAYLPKLAHHNKTDDSEGKDYHDYKYRAGVYEAASRTMIGLVGLLNRKPGTFEVPDKMKEWLEDITLSGCDIQTFAVQLSREVCTSGRVGVYVGYDTEAKRPYSEVFSAEHIHNWREDRLKGRILPLFVVLESETYDDTDPYDPKPQEARIELRYNAETGGYESILHEKTDQGWVEGGAVPYTVRGSKVFEKCPFVPINGIKNGFHVEKPPLSGLIHENHRHYMESADYARSRHRMGPWFFALGVDLEDDEELIVGGPAAFTHTNENAKVGVVGYEGAGLEIHERVMDAMEKRMAILGARMLETQKREAETVESKKIGMLGDTATLSTIAESISQGIETALKLMAELEGIPSEEITASINKDFVDQAMDPDGALKIVEAWQKGGFTKQDMFFNLQRGEILEPSAEFEEWSERLEKEGMEGFGSDLPGPTENEEPEEQFAQTNSEKR